MNKALVFIFIGVFIISGCVPKEEAKQMLKEAREEAKTEEISQRVELTDFAEYILLTNFSNYVEIFANKFNVEINGEDKPMKSATANNITIINFGMGSAMAATIMDLLSAIQPKAVLFLGKCGGLKKKTQLVT